MNFHYQLLRFVNNIDLNICGMYILESFFVICLMCSLLLLLMVACALAECGSSVEAAVAPAPRHMPFAVGERVRVVVSVDELRTMQEGHGGWNHKMAEVGCAGRPDWG